MATGGVATNEAEPQRAGEGDEIGAGAGTFPLRASALVLAALFGGAFASIVLSGVALAVTDAEWLAILVGSLALYAAMLLACVRASRRYGTGDVPRDLGFRFRLADLGWGPLTWLGMFASAVAVGVLFQNFPEFEGTNTDLLAEDPSTSTLVVLVLVAVIGAPVFEELVFRGLLLNALRGAMPDAVAIGLQALAFGAVHLQPDEGLGNVGLVASLTAVGAVLGFAAVRAARLGPAVIGHGLFNLAATVAVLAMD